MSDDEDTDVALTTIQGLKPENAVLEEELHPAAANGHRSQMKGLICN